MNSSWDFDDGDFSSAFSPSHIYLSNGNYNVSLIINDSNSCSDTLFRNIFISSIDTNSLIIAGHVLINGSIGAAKVSLISNVSGEYKIIDEMDGIDGKYAFNINPNSTYYIRSSPSDLLPNKYQIQPAYYLNATFWQDATAVVISNQSSTNNDFDMSMVQNPIGTASIQGNIGTYQGLGKQNIPYKNADIYVYNDLGKFITRDESDENGNYNLSNLFLGNYLIYADVIGHTSAQSYQSIAQHGTIIDGVDFTIYPEYILDIETKKQKTIDVKIYPNPAFNTLNVEGNFNKNMKWKIFSLEGRLYSCDQKESAISSKLEINIEKLPIGYYLIELKDKEIIKTLSFIKMN